MICRRRVTRNPLVFLGLFCLLVFYLYFYGNFSFSNPSNNIKYQNIDSNADNIIDGDSVKELARLQSLDVKNNHNFVKVSDDEKLRLEREELIRKFNETLKQQEEENDPFKPLEDIEYVDFINFNPDFKETKYTPKDLRPIIEDLNKREIMYNNELYKKLPEHHPVIVIQVHKRIEYFRELLDSLQRTRGIKNVVLVVSHDFYSDIMNALIRKIQFCKVIQIFFPYSLQLYPEEFPGPSKDDCPRDMEKRVALKNRCTNAEHPDKYGHYREAHITMTKHHWWWKINMVFDHLKATKKHQGPFVFIEEDHYVAASFYEALMALHELKQTDPRCKDSCDILTMGSYNNKDNFQFDGSKVLHGKWISSQHNMGMGLYRTTWEKLRNCATEFCTYDDYNWDWTLLFLSKTCFPQTLSVLVYDVPRMFHVGDCGLHHVQNCANAKDTLKKVKNMLERNKDFLFTDKLTVFTENTVVVPPKPNGGWGDVRDHELCERFVKVESSLMRR